MSTMILSTLKKNHLSDCGCAACKGECGELECLVQPRFFCGQLLTDQDLSVLLEWVKGKTALTRYRHGWGAVCGLEVYCNAESGAESVVSVMPGYAVDCYGNDIIVCRKASLDLSKFCKPDEDPCGEWPPPEQPGTITGNLKFGGWEIPKSDVQAVDLFVSYAETSSDARTALARGGCDPAEACEYTRTQEGYNLYAKKAEYCDQSADKRAIDWEEGYRKGLKELFDNLEANFDQADPRRTLERMSLWLKSRTLYGFCFVREWLCDLQRMTDLPQDWFARMIFWLVQDWRNYYFQCDCYGCGPDSGVPLARVWLWRQKDARGKYICKVIYINSYPPFRRPLQPECWPTPHGYLSLAPFVWQPVDYVFTELRNQGFDDIATERFVYKDLRGLREQLNSDQLFVPRLDRTGANSLIIYYNDDNCEQRRVVRFAFGPQPARQGVNLANMANDDPALDLRRLSGIGDASARRLREHGITNLKDVAAATPTRLQDALKDTPINPPNLARCQLFIDDAKALLTKIAQGG